MTYTMEEMGVLEEGTYNATKYIRIKYPEFDQTQNCANGETDLMFGGYEDDPDAGWGTSKDNMAMAKKICDGCPFKQPCAKWGISHEEFGVWGGMTQTEREHARKQLGIGIARPEYFHLYFGEPTGRRLRYLEWKQKQDELMKEFED